VHWPQGVDRKAECDRAKVDERRTHEPEVGDIGLRSSLTVASQEIALHQSSPRAVQSPKLSRARGMSVG
jgi:hypothetical protein